MPSIYNDLTLRDFTTVHTQDLVLRLAIQDELYEVPDCFKSALQVAAYDPQHKFTSLLNDPNEFANLECFANQLLTGSFGVQLLTIPIKSTLYQMLTQWWRQKTNQPDLNLYQALQPSYQNHKNFYLEVGINYDVIDSDLLGGNGDGSTRKTFETMVANQASKKAKQIITLDNAVLYQSFYELAHDNKTWYEYFKFDVDTPLSQALAYVRQHIDFVVDLTDDEQQQIIAQSYSEQVQFGVELFKRHRIRHRLSLKPINMNDIPRKLRGKLMEQTRIALITAKFTSAGFIVSIPTHDTDGFDFTITESPSHNTHLIQLKSRVSVNKKYLNKNLYMMFPLADGQYVTIKHDWLWHYIWDIKQYKNKAHTRVDWTNSSINPTSELGQAILKHSIYPPFKLDQDFPDYITNNFE